MHSSCPIVLHGLSMTDLLQHLTATHSAPTTLIVCSSRDLFEHQLLRALGASSLHVDQDEHARKHPLATPTLQLLKSTLTIHLAFCPSLEALRAHLAVYRTNHVSEVSGGTREPMLCILNMLALHRETTSFSAQGISRTLAIAVEAAARCGQKLVISECPGPSDTITGEYRHEAAERLPQDAEASVDQEPSEPQDPWSEQLSILNVTTKSFGVGSRGWAGRTVSARAVAERWCRFERYQGVQARQGV
ncbi:hypothetical protein IWX90DRAFT_289928 [Phyllosticta citrichinensis]|uniref:Elongator complex protein 5 n=1 Tax=Phyllosticta citrichinensis TaxID=1130410 RepID=A0ABR1XPI0_9PEZI